MKIRLKREAYSEAKIPEGISYEDLIVAIHALDSGAEHAFGQSTGYDVIHKGKIYPPKAIVGLAAQRILGRPLGPYDFKGGLNTKCFRILLSHGFQITAKGPYPVFPDEIESHEYLEGVGKKVYVNRYERNSAARAECIRHYGSCCTVCKIAFTDVYGTLGENFIHVHHIVPLSSIRTGYIINPIEDLRPVCPNCHAMLHKRIPPMTILELQEVFSRHFKVIGTEIK